MAGFTCDQYGCLGVMTIVAGSFPMNCPAWDLTGYPKLWSEHAIRTDSVVLPTAAGQRSYPGRMDQTDYDLTLYVNGEVDRNGTPWSDPWAGLYANLQDLWTNALSPVGSGRGTRAATLTTPSATTLAADIKFEPLRSTGDVEDPSFVVYRVTLTVPAGRFA